MNQVSRQVAWITILLTIGIALRFLIASVGFTYDMQSYNIVGKIVNSGGNVYRETTRYNYGPLWFLIVGAFYKFSNYFVDSFLVFRFSLTGLLVIVDVFIWYLLY
jgi:hypothetical protein